MCTHGISQVNVLESELFPFLTCCSAICCQLEVIIILKIHYLDKKIPSTDVVKCIQLLMTTCFSMFSFKIQGSEWLC